MESSSQAFEILVFLRVLKGQESLREAGVGSPGEAVFCASTLLKQVGARRRWRNPQFPAHSSKFR